MSFKIVSGFAILLVCLSVVAAEGIPGEFTLPGLVPCNHTETPTAKLKWNWAGHVCRMHPDRWAKIATEWVPGDGRRRRGRPRRRWRDDLVKYLPDWEGASCVDCSRLLICTKLGGIIVPCWLPGPHCNNGTCSTEPSDECEVTTTPSDSSANADSFVLSDSFVSADSFVRVADPVIESEMFEQNEQPIEVLPYALPPIRVADNDDDDSEQ